MNECKVTYEKSQKKRNFAQKLCKNYGLWHRRMRLSFNYDARLIKNR